MRAKLRITKIDRFNGGENLTFAAVCPDEFGKDGENEDNTFARYTPVADLNMCVQNPDLVGKFQEGQTFYVDFTPVQP